MGKLKVSGTNFHVVYTLCKTVSVCSTCVFSVVTRCSDLNRDLDWFCFFLLVQNTKLCFCTDHFIILEGLMTLLRSIGKAYLELAHYNCEKAMDLFEQLPAHQRMTPWVLASMGKAYFEMGKYKEAAMFFSIAKEKDIASTYMMEYYSSALWQLGKNVELSDLAQVRT